MKIVHVTPYFIPNHNGGVETHVYELSKELIKQGHKIIVYTCSRTPKYLDGITVHSFPSFNLIPEVKLGRYINIDRVDNPCPSPSLTRELKREKANIVHLHGQEFITSLVGFYAARSAKIPCVLTLHSNGYALDHMWIIRLLRRGLYRSLFKVMINHSDAVVLPTGEASELVERYGLKPRITVHIPLAIDLARFNDVKKRQDYVLYVGRLNPVKGPELLVKAAPLILKEVDTKFIIAGDGFQRPYLERLASKLEVYSKIRFLGSVPYKKVPELIGHASVFVAPGGAGYTLLEAGALGKPIVSVRLEWNISCIGKEGAYYVAPRDERGLAEAVVKILKDHDLSEKISTRAMNFVRSTRSWDATIERYVSLYKSFGKALG